MASQQCHMANKWLKNENWFPPSFLPLFPSSTSPPCVSLTQPPPPHLRWLGWIICHLSCIDHTGNLFSLSMHSTSLSVVKVQQSKVWHEDLGFLPSAWTSNLMVPWFQCFSASTPNITSCCPQSTVHSHVNVHTNTVCFPHHFHCSMILKHDKFFSKCVRASVLFCSSSAASLAHWHMHTCSAFMRTHTQITNTGSTQTEGNMRLMMNGLPGPVPIPLGAALGCHVCVITLDVILFPLTEAMWIFTAVACLCVCLCLGVCAWTQNDGSCYLSNGAKKWQTEGRNRNRKQDKLILYKSNSVYTMNFDTDAATSEITNYEKNILFCKKCQKKSCRYDKWK